MNQFVLHNLIRHRAESQRIAYIRGESQDNWRQGMLPYQVEMLEKHDQEVAETAQRLRQEK